MIEFTGGITQTGEENRSELEAATNAATRANVSIYEVDARGLLAEIPGGDATTGAASGTSMFSGNAVYAQTQSREDSRETLSTLATDTGGRAFFDLGDFSEAFSAVQADGTGYYLLGYYSSDSAHDGRWRNVKVKINGLPSGAHLHYREGYYAPKDFGVFTTEDRERQIEDAMDSDSPLVELPVAVETAQFRISDTQVFVPIAAKIASSALEWAQKSGRRQTEFDFAAEIRTASTNRVVSALRDTITVQLDTARYQQVQQQALLYQGGFLLQPGNYKLKFLVRENESGRIGTFEENLSLPAPQADRLQLSSVLLFEPARRGEENVRGENAGARAGREDAVFAAGRGGRTHRAERDARLHRPADDVRFLPGVPAGEIRSGFAARGAGFFPQRRAGEPDADGRAG